MSSENATDFDLDAYVASEIQARIVAIEKERQEKESGDACFVAHGGSWDSSTKELSRQVHAAVLAVAKDRKDANKLLDVIFSKVGVYYSDSGGDHHTGYFEDYSVSTADAVSLAQNREELSRILMAAS